MGALVKHPARQDERATSGRRGEHGARGDRERGAATLLSAVVSIALIAVVWLGCQLGSAVIARKQAEGAADLAALAAAGHSAQGPQSACRSAGWVVREMRVGLVSCRLLGADARVEVRGDPSRVGNPGVPGETFQVRARARAGPAAA